MVGSEFWRLACAVTTSCRDDFTRGMSEPEASESAGEGVVRLLWSGWGFLDLLNCTGGPESPDRLGVVGATRRLLEGPPVPLWLRLAALLASLRSAAVLTSSRSPSLSPLSVPPTATAATPSSRVAMLPVRPVGGAPIGRAARSPTDCVARRFAPALLIPRAIPARDGTRASARRVDWY